MPPPYAFRCSLEDDAIVVKLSSPNTQDCEQNLSIRFMRMIRVADDAGEVNLPSNPDPFPLFSVRSFTSRLPREIAAKAGVFFPMYQREAMWIEFKADSPFMVKIYAGGVNAVSGEHNLETPETKKRRFERKDIQDYVVVPPQPWLAGCAVSPGAVRQFVAMPLRTGYSVEAQLTGQEIVSSLQCEITPSLPKIYQVPVKVYPLCTPSEDFSINIRTLTGFVIPIRCSSTDTIGSVKNNIQSVNGLSPGYQKLIFSYESLDDDQTLGYYGVKNKDIIYLVLGRSCATCARNSPITITADGTVERCIWNDDIPDNWAKTSTITIPVHILTTESFRQVTGQSAPPCPIKMSTYAEAGLPFFNLKFPEEPSARKGSKAKSGVPTIHPPDEGPATGGFVDQATIEDPDGLVNPDGPLRAFRMLRTLREELRRDDESRRNT
ncbi:hypothetical protein F5B21DRAFT_524455 [Xylaria acuta]|nr:hypothetical protein F5B21DRAFT_524455 [Xylaria acuta]